CKKLGYSEEEIKAKSLQHIHPKEDQARIERLFFMQARGEIDIAEDIPFFRKNGDISYFDVNSALLEINGRKCVAGLLRDITERKQAEEALRESERKFRRIFESANDAMIYLDKLGFVLDVNQKAVEITGASREELQGKHFTQAAALSVKDIPRLMWAFRGLLQGQNPSLNVVVKTKRGVETPLECTASLIKANDKVVGAMVVARDITERKEAERALVESEEKFRSLSESSPMGVWQTDNEGRVLYTNKRWQEITGLTLEESLGFGWSNALHPDDKKRIFEEWGRCVSEEKSWSGEFRFVSPSGEVRWVYTTTALIRSETGQVTGHVGSNEDITERKLAEDALQESEERYRAIVEDQTELICRNLADSTITFVNEAYCRCFDRSREELVGHKFMPLIPEADCAKVKEHFATLGPDRPVATHEHRVIMPDGRIRWQRWTNRAIFDDAGNIIEFQGAGRDITERKKAQEALQQSEQKYRSLIANIPDVVWTSDENGNTTFISANVEDIFGYSPEEIYSQGDRLWFGRIHPDDLERVVKEAFKAVFEEGKRLDVEYRIRRKDGQWIWIQDRSIGAYEKDGVKYADGVFFDITERKQAEEALRESEETAAALLNATSDAALLIDGQGSVIALNKSMAESLGTTAEEIIGTVIYDYLPPDLARQRRARGLEATHTRGPVRFEDQRAGRWLENSVFPIFTPQGDIARYAIYSRDITERKEAEQERRRLTAILEATSDFVSTATPDGRITYINRAGRRMIGLADDEDRIERRIADAHPDWAFRIIENEGIPAAFERGLWKGETALLGPGGVEIPTSQVIMSHKTAEGEVEYLSTIVRDVTERKRSERAMRESEERFRTLFESAPDAIYLNDLEGHFVDGNRAAEELAGSAKEELIGKNFMEIGLLAPEDIDKAISNMKDSAQGKPTGPDEFTLMRKDGSRVTLEIRTFPVKIKDQMLSLGIARDITDRKLAQDQLLAYQGRLRSLASELALAEERERRRIATDLHDNVSQALALSLMQLQSMRDSADAAAAEPIGAICTTIGKTVEEVRGLTFGLCSPTLYRFGLEAAVAELLHERLANRSELDYQFNNDKQSKPLVDDVKVTLFQSVRELVINVIKHARARNILVDIGRDNDNIRIAVGDDGVGFDVAQQVESPKKLGGGFGLFNITERLEYMGGSVKIESRPGRGSRVTLVAPLRAETELPGGKSNGGQGTAGR
ncbi:MAG: PAS domain S-box protein, partial [Planctomycetota bacterium]